jgi:hypothetical protein
MSMTRAKIKLKSKIKIKLSTLCFVFDFVFTCIKNDAYGSIFYAYAFNQWKINE